jgi:hypothetical protein
MMDSKAGQIHEEVSVRFTIEGMIGEVIEWHAIRNLSDQEELNTLQVQTPGDKWAQMIRVGAEHMRQIGHLPLDFQKWYFEYIGIEFQGRGKH